jgi:2'-5' RNA ligase
MATPPAKPRSSGQPPSALATAGGGIIGGAPAAAASGAALAGSAKAQRTAVQKAIEAVLGLLQAIALRRDKMIRAKIAAAFPTTDIEKAMAEEARREVVFRKRSEQRTRDGMKLAMAAKDPSAKAAAIQNVLTRERRFAEQRTRAAGERVLASAERQELRTHSPQGALWLLGPTEQHCPVCPILANRFWPWAILDRLPIPLHVGCKCRLISFGEAIKEGLLDPSAIPTEQAALQIAGGAIKTYEEWQAEAERKYGHLAENLLVEAWNPADHPRNERGRFIDKIARQILKGSLGSARNEIGGTETDRSKVFTAVKKTASRHAEDALSEPEHAAAVKRWSRDQLEKDIVKRVVHVVRREYAKKDNERRLRSLEESAVEELAVRSALVQHHGANADLLAAQPLAVDAELAEADIPAEPPAHIQEAEANKDGAMVALYPAESKAPDLALKGGEKPEELHVTLAFLGKAEDLDFDAAKKVVEAWAKKTPRLQGKLSGVGHFDLGQGKKATYRSVDLPKLSAPREELVKALDKAGVPAKKDHGFTPHLTLSYSVRRPPIKQEGIRFDRVDLSWGEDRHSFKLEGS